MRAILRLFRNTALVAFAATALAASPAAARPDCETSPSGQCLCCYAGCCLVICGTNWCDCCDLGGCHGPGCNQT